MNEASRSLVYLKLPKLPDGFAAANYKSMRSSYRTMHEQSGVLTLTGCSTTRKELVESRHFQKAMATAAENIADFRQNGADCLSNSHEIIGEDE